MSSSLTILVLLNAVLTFGFVAFFLTLCAYFGTKPTSDSVLDSVRRR
jgi:hypothetical protein